MNPIAEAEYRSWNTGKSFNRCLDEIYEEDIAQRIEEAKYEEQYVKEQLREYEAERPDADKERGG